jgi:hypothetical protein
MIATDARISTRYIAKGVGFSVGAAHTIPICNLEMRRISAIHHLLTKEQKSKTCSGKNLQTIVETVP